VVSEGTRKTPHGVVVHVENQTPVWRTTNASIDPVFDILFSQEKVFVNIQSDDNSFDRREITLADSDFLEYAATGVNLPLYVMRRGRWDVETADIGEVLNYLADRFLKNDLKE